jgi:hypothetical protein
LEVSAVESLLTSEWPLKEACSAADEEYRILPFLISSSDEGEGRWLKTGRQNYSCFMGRELEGSGRKKRRKKYPCAGPMVCYLIRYKKMVWVLK